MISFEELWELHWKWRKGILLKEIVVGKTADIYIGTPQDKYSTFAVPKVENPGDFDLQEVEIHIPDTLLRPVLLLDRQRKQGFYEYLIKNGYVFETTTSWLVYDGPFTPYSDAFSAQIAPITLENFTDLISVMDRNDSEYGTPHESAPYYQAYQALLTTPGYDSGTQVEFFGIYEEKKPIQVGTLVYSVKENFAFITFGAALQDHQHKLSKNRHYLQLHRLNRAIELGITRIYTLQSFGTKTWRNFLWLNFKEIQEDRLFVKHK